MCLGGATASATRRRLLHIQVGHVVLADELGYAGLRDVREEIQLPRSTRRPTLRASGVDDWTLAPPGHSPRCGSALGCGAAARQRDPAGHPPLVPRRLVVLVLLRPAERPLCHQGPERRVLAGCRVTWGPRWQRRPPPGGGRVL